MEVRATAKGLRVSPKKARLVVDVVRGKSASEALAILRFMPSPTARVVSRVVKSAVANAENNYQMAPADLRVTKAYVDDGARMKRMRCGGRGRASRIIRRLSHITVVVEEK